MKKIVLILLVMLFTACSQKNPTIDLQNNRFENKFYPAKIDSNYVKGDISTQKYPIIFLLGAYEGGWREDAHVHKLQKLGYHVVSITFYNKEGFSNNLANINIDEIKKIMDSYKRYSSVDASSVGIVGQGKGAELALLMASYYPDIKMVVGISTPHVSFQSSRATLLTEPSWIHQGKEVPYVAYPKLSLTAIKTVVRLLKRKVNGYRDLHDLAIENEQAVEKARIKVENINGDIFLASLTEDGMWNSPLMGNEIIKRLKEKKFTHQFEHKSYRGSWFLSSSTSEEKRAWSDIYRFITKSFNLDYTHNMFSSRDIDGDKGVSLEEYISDTEEEDKKMKTFMLKMFSTCDSNHDYKIDYSEVRMSIVHTNDSYYNSDVINPNYIPLPSVNHACRVSQSDFKEYDLDSDKSVSFNEFIRHLKKRNQNVYIVPINIIELNKENNAKDRFKQCDNNSDKKIDKKEAMLETCHINKFVFTIADKNKNSFISMDELIALPAKYSQYRYPFYLPSEDDKVVYMNPYNSEITEIYNLLFNSIDECDDNRDFKIDKSEATAKKCGFTEEEFVEADANKDGQFETKDVRRLNKAKFFKKIDEDNNGKLDFYEWITVY